MFLLYYHFVSPKSRKALLSARKHKFWLKSEKFRAILNVKINLSSIKDIEYVALMTQEANYLESEAIMKEQELLSRVSKIL